MTDVAIPEYLTAELPGYRGRLTRAQVKRLLRAVDSAKIEKKQNLSYLPQQEARAELIRIFGPGGSDHRMTKPELLYETEVVSGMPNYPKNKDGSEKNGGKGSYWVVGYMVGCDLTVFDYWGRLVYNCLEWHAEENAPLPNRGEAHAMAVTSAQSYALRRALISLGDAFGLHLYDKGSLAPIVGRTYLLEDKHSPLYEAPTEAASESTPGPATARLQAATNVAKEGTTA